MLFWVSPRHVVDQDLRHQNLTYLWICAKVVDLCKKGVDNGFAPKLWICTWANAVCGAKPFEEVSQVVHPCPFRCIIVACLAVVFVNVWS